MLNRLPTKLARKHVAVVHHRLAAVVGAVALGLAAIVFARMGEVAQKLFLHLVAIARPHPPTIRPFKAREGLPGTCPSLTDPAGVVLAFHRTNR